MYMICLYLEMVMYVEEPRSFKEKKKLFLQDSCFTTMKIIHILFNIVKLIFCLFIFLSLKA